MAVRFLSRRAEMKLSRSASLVILICPSHLSTVKMSLPWMTPRIICYSICIMWTSPVNFRFPFIWKCSHSIEVWRISLSIDSINHRSWTHRSVALMVGPSSVLRVNSFPSLLGLKQRLSRVDSTNETLYRYFLDNRRTVNHQSLIFGLRELNWNETLQFCFDSFLNTAQPPITSEGIHFTADYELRIYTAGCYYVDTNNNWKSDGLIVRIRWPLRH